MDAKKLSGMIYKDADKTPEFFEEKYPKRDLPEGAKVTRLGPSPTGFIHLGNLYGAFVDERLAHQSGGVFYLRIEDTDDKRHVDNAVETIISSLSFFGISFDEGVTENGDIGEYGDYTQSRRAEIYQTFAKKLLSEGKAYPCFLKEDEIAEIREKQEALKIAPGIYRGWSKYRDWDTGEGLAAEVEEKIASGEPFVLRLKSTGEPNASAEELKRTTVTDGIRGKLEVPHNFQDVVILKANGIPTYHFAHVIDDHLMRTTHVVRGEEWLPSLPIHIELFDKLGWEPPVYCHTAQLMKIGEDGNKRKLSKRKDPELSLDYYRKLGYHRTALREYLLTVLNSDFEEWRTANPDLPIEDFDFTTKKMSRSGSLFDLDKLNDISKDTLLRIPAKELVKFLKDWSDEFAPQYAGRFEDEEYIEKILDIGRGDAKPRKDLVFAQQIMDFIGYFFDDSFRLEDAYPAETCGDEEKILEAYLNGYDHADDQEAWFNKIRSIATDLGYAAKPKDYKKHPDEYKGHVGHVSTVIRIALMGRAQSPDVWTIQQIVDEDKVRGRIEKELRRLREVGEPMLVVMAAGTGSRYGGDKQIDPVTSEGDIIMDFSLFDAYKAGFRKVAFIIKPDFEEAFKAHMEERAGKYLDLRYVYQDINDIPEGYAVPEGRTKPWGTAHAVYSARNEIDGPFAVINADDFYGAEAFRVIYDFLKNDVTPSDYCMVAFDIENTLSENGTVSRGICNEKDGRLADIEEHTEVGLESVDDVSGELGGHGEQARDGLIITGIGMDGAKKIIPFGTPVSMNLWGFDRTFISRIESDFDGALEEILAKNPLKGEFYLPFCVDKLIKSGETVVTVLHSGDKWFGITYKEDKEKVSERFAEMKDKKIYPADLWDR